MSKLHRFPHPTVGKQLHIQQILPLSNQDVFQRHIVQHCDSLPFTERHHLTHRIAVGQQVVQIAVQKLPQSASSCAHRHLTAPSPQFLLCLPVGTFQFKIPHQPNDFPDGCIHQRHRLPDLLKQPALCFAAQSLRHPAFR